MLFIYNKIAVRFVECQEKRNIFQIAPQFDDVLYGCKWTQLNESCYNLFTPSMTDDGLCFTFNVLDRSAIFRNNV